MVYLGHLTHYFHKNIAGPKVSAWKGGYRNFNDEMEMSREIVYQINKHVKEDDILYHLGDWSFGGINNIWNFRKQINCKNIHLILGNHDHHIEHNKNIRIFSEDWYKFDTLKTPVDFDGNNYMVEKLSYIDIPVNTLFKSINYVKAVTIGKNKFFLSHFAHRVWDKSHHGVIHLYGHSHATIDDEWGKSMDVGIDAAYKRYGAYRPFHINEIVGIMNKRKVKVLDHHNGDTNE